MALNTGCGLRKKETKNTKETENRTFGFIRSLQIQLCSLLGYIRPLSSAFAVFDFQNNQIGLNDPNGNKNIMYSMMKFCKIVDCHICYFPTLV